MIAKGSAKLQLCNAIAVEELTAMLTIGLTDVNPKRFHCTLIGQAQSFVVQLHDDIHEIR